MLLQIADVVDKARTKAIRDASAAAGFWTDGRATAAGRAREAKNNQQALIDGPAKGVLELLSRVILSNEVVVNAAAPAALVRIMLNRYGEGMEYGAHIDAPYIDGVRTDLSFTLFLSDPETYEGGALAIDHAGAEDIIKPPAGTLVIYPASTVHRVLGVSKGERIACVGWIKSRIRSPEDRAILFELARIDADLRAVGTKGDIRERLVNLRNNLLRRWGD